MRGYDVDQSAGLLDLTLYWQASGPLRESYKRFLHLVDPSDGRVVAQNDAVPRDWTYPPSIWESGEIVADRVSLPLEGVGTGSYELRAGWYAIENGQILPACPTGDCMAQIADFHWLADIQIP